MSWTEVCKLSDIPPNAGAAALLAGKQIAIFNVDGKVYAIDNRDPFSGANVLSRGIVGSIGDDLVVASPIYKQHFALRTGTCIEDAAKSVHAYPASLDGDRVMISLAAVEAA